MCKENKKHPPFKLYLKTINSNNNNQYVNWKLCIFWCQWLLYYLSTFCFLHLFIWERVSQSFPLYSSEIRAYITYVIWVVWQKSASGVVVGLGGQNSHQFFPQFRDFLNVNSQILKGIRLPSIQSDKVRGTHIYILYIQHITYTILVYIAGSLNPPPSGDITTSWSRR